MGFSGSVRAAVCVAMIAIALAAIATGCGMIGDSAGEPLPANSRSSFRVQSISGINFTGADDENILFGTGIRLSLHIHDVSLASLSAACVRGSGLVRLTSDQLIIKGFDPTFTADNGRCRPEQIEAVERVSAVLSASPRYRFDGQRLELISDQTTVTLALIEIEDLVVTDTGEIIPRSTRSS